MCGNDKGYLLTLTCICAETQLEAHDINLPAQIAKIPESTDTISTRRYRFLLFSPSAVSEPRLEATLKRLHHFSSLTGGQDIAIIFLLSPQDSCNFNATANTISEDSNVHGQSMDGMKAFTLLQSILTENFDISIPLLPISSLSELPARLIKHVSFQSVPSAVATRNSMDLLGLCTANPPMPIQSAFILSDLFFSIRDLAEACTSATPALTSSSDSESVTNDPGISVSQMIREGEINCTQGHTNKCNRLQRLRGLIGEQSCKDIMDFWKEEWLFE